MNKKFRILWVIGLIACLGLTDTVFAKPNFVCIMQGEQQIPPVSSPAIGSGTFVINTAAKTLKMHISFSGLTSPITMAHIHGPGAITRWLQAWIN